VPQRATRVFVPNLQSDLVINAAAIANDLAQPEYLLLDARAAERYRGDVEPIDPVGGHIPGAINAPFPENLNPDGTFRPAEALQQRFATLFGDVPPDRVVCYCGSGVTAAHNLLAIHHAGLGDVKLYAGSWSEWITDPTRPIAVGDS
jgi:thiosulfate/3-mercaptopyruvate sulfurtransferase